MHPKRPSLILGIDEDAHGMSEIHFRRKVQDEIPHVRYTVSGRIAFLNLTEIPDQAIAMRGIHV